MCVTNNLPLLWYFFSFWDTLTYLDLGQETDPTFSSPRNLISRFSDICTTEKCLICVWVNRWPENLPTRIKMYQLDYRRWWCLKMASMNPRSEREENYPENWEKPYFIRLLDRCCWPNVHFTIWMYRGASCSSSPDRVVETRGARGQFFSILWVILLPLRLWIHRGYF